MSNVNNHPQQQDALSPANTASSAAGIPIEQLNTVQRAAMDALVKAQNELPPRPVRPVGPMTQAYLDELEAYRALFQEYMTKLEAFFRLIKGDSELMSAIGGTQGQSGSSSSDGGGASAAGSGGYVPRLEVNLSIDSSTPPESVGRQLRQALDVGLRMMARLDPEWAANTRQERLSDEQVDCILRCETREDREQLFARLLHDIIEEEADYVNMIWDVDAAPVRTPDMSEDWWRAEQHTFAEALKWSKIGIEAIKTAVYLHESLYGEGT